MRLTGYTVLLVGAMLALSSMIPCAAGQNGASVTTYHNDIARTGQNLLETVLTPATVGAGLFDRLFAFPVDGYVYAQPLVLSGVRIPGKGTRDLVIVATEHDTVYAFDADAPSAQAPIWKVSFVDPSQGVTTVPFTDVSSGDLQPEIGITGTPVIDPDTDTLYVVAKTKEGPASSPTYRFRLHALNIATGAERPGSPVVISASSAGTSSDADHGVVHFNSLREHNRMGLLLMNGAVYIPFASHGDNQPYHGWLLGYDARTLAQVAVYDATPADGLGGFWEGADAPAADSDGNIYLSTGNAVFDPAKANYGDSVLKLSTRGAGLTLADSFTPMDQAALNAGDADLGSGGITILPQSAGSAINPRLMVTAGKEGKLYLINRDRMGSYDPAADHVVESVAGLGALFATPAYFDGSLYYAGNGRPLVALSVGDGRISEQPISQTSINLGGRAATPSVSADGNENGIVWIVVVGRPGALLAFDARDLSHTLYASSGDEIPEGIKFNASTIANGRVYVGSSNCLVVFGLLGTAKAKPDQPQDVSAKSVGRSFATISWKERDAADLAGYRVEASTDHGRTYATLGSAARDQEQFVAAGLDPHRRYELRLIAINALGESKPSRSVVVVTKPLPVPTGLAAYLPFDDGRGSMARDIVAGGPSASLVGEYTWVGAGGTSSRSTLSLHGTGQAPSEAVVPDEPQLRFSAAQSFTWCVNVEPVVPVSRAETILSKAYTSQAPCLIGIDSSGAWTFGGPAGAITGGQASPGAHEIVAVQDAASGTRRLIVDGVQVASGTVQAADGFGDLWIGASPAGGDGFKGTVGDVAVYDRALSEAEVSAISQAQRVAMAPTGGR